MDMLSLIDIGTSSKQLEFNVFMMPGKLHSGYSLCIDQIFKALSIITNLIGSEKSESEIITRNTKKFKI